MHRHPLFIITAAVGGAWRRHQPARCRPEEWQPPAPDIGSYGGGGGGDQPSAAFDLGPSYNEARTAVKDLQKRARDQQEEAAECARDGLFVALYADDFMADEHSRIWMRNSDGARHREGDRPAVECGNGTREWWKDGQRHRANDLPAIEHFDGRRDWLVDGEYHRCDHGLPAVVLVDGTRVWVHPATGLVHRDHGLPAIERASDGTLEYFEAGLRHRAGDLPAVVGPHTVRYFEHGREVDRPDTRGSEIPYAVNSGVICFKGVVADNNPTRKSVRTFWSKRYHWSI